MTHDPVTFKRGQTFAFTWQMEHPFAYDPDPQNWTIDCQLRGRSGDDLHQVTMLKLGLESDPTGAFDFAIDGTVGGYVAAASTREWDLGTWDFDVRFTHTDGTIEITPTITISVIERVTRNVA